MDATISVGVRYHNILERHAGVREETLTLPAGARLLDALEQIATSHGPPLRSLLFSPSGTVAAHLIVFCSNQLVGGDRAARPLSDGDQLMLFPATSGG
jgi:molybdopterin converting factor small subunit